MMKFVCLTLALATPFAASAQTADPTKAYIDAGFATMDANKDGKVTPAEFDRFMRARLARQAASFDTAFAQIDANNDGSITAAEAASGNALLAQHFAEVDTDRNGSVSKVELRAAMMAGQAQEAAGN
jgi:hypothetical protein